MRKLLLALATIAAAGALARKLAVRGNTRVHRINQSATRTAPEATHQ